MGLFIEIFSRCQYRATYRIPWYIPGITKIRHLFEQFESWVSRQRQGVLITTSDASRQPSRRNLSETTIHFLCVCPPCFGENRVWNSSPRGVCYLDYYGIRYYYRAPQEKRLLHLTCRSTRPKCILYWYILYTMHIMLAIGQCVVLF